MQVQTHVNSISLPPNYATNQPTSASTSDSFAESLASAGQSFTTINAYVQQKEIVEVAPPIEPYKPVKIVPEIERSSKVVGGVTWTDKLLAFCASVKNDSMTAEIKIDMSKSFDWNATGDRTLTADELSELRKKYDLENLSGQGFYDLMADLSNLNAIGAEDIHGMFLKPAPAEPILYPSTEFGDGSSFDEGDVFDALNKEFKAIEREKKFLLSDEFWLMNSSADKGKHSDYIDALDSRVDSMNKLYNLFSAIRG